MPARRHNAILVQRLKRNDFHMKHRIGTIDSKKASEESSAFCCFGKSSSLEKDKKKKMPTTVLAQRRRQQQVYNSRGEEPIITESPTNDTILEESSSDLSASTTEDTPIKRVRFASEVEIRRIGDVHVEEQHTTKSPIKPSRSKRNLKQSIVNRSEFDKKIQRDNKSQAKRKSNTSAQQ